MQAPAQASVSYSYRAETSTADGYAHVHGAVVFNGPRDFSVAANIADVCASSGAGDGEGAYAWAEMRYTDGTSDIGRFWNVGFDNNGCGSVSNTTRFISPFTQWNKRVASVRIRLDESAGSKGASSSTAFSTWKDNPYT